MLVSGSQPNENSNSDGFTSMWLVGAAILVKVFSLLFLLLMLREFDGLRLMWSSKKTSAQ